ncbi:MAG: M15 family metallopeptidase [Aridibacter sp.]
MTEAEVNLINQQRLSQVNSILANACWHIILSAKSLGYTLIVAEGYRTPEKQNEYYAQGRTKRGSIITYKKGNEGKHTQGKAVDFDFVINGKQSNSNNNNWSIIGKIAKQLGLIWGGDWKFRDYRHVEISDNYQLPNGLALNQVSTNNSNIGNIAIGFILLILLIRE